MKDTLVVFAVFVAVSTTTISIVGGIANAREQGRQDACKTVQLEWVKDKCMKVTREAI